MKLGRRTVIVLWALLFVVVAGSWYYFNEGLKTNAQSLRVMLAITECTAEDTPAECRHRQDAREKEEGVARVAEVDCRVRRALAGLPPIPPTERCKL